MGVNRRAPAARRMSSLNFSSAPRLTYEDFAPIPESGEEETFASAEVDAFLASKTPLAFFRRKRGMSQDTLAKRAGITKSYLSGIEIGRKSGDVRTLRKLANGLKTTLKVKIDQTVLLAPF